MAEASVTFSSDLFHMPPDKQCHCFGNPRLQFRNLVALTKHPSCSSIKSSDTVLGQVTLEARRIKCDPGHHILSKIVCYLVRRWKHWNLYELWGISELIKVSRLMWNKKPTRCHLVLYLFLLYKFLNMFWATLCPSSGADDLVVFLPHVV